MSVRTFPALGFDPAPGSPAALLAEARSASLAARALAAAAVSAGRLDAGWSGAAATAYRAEARPLPRDLGLAAAAHTILARELTAFAEDLSLRQHRAAALESRAVELRAHLASAGPAGALVSRGRGERAAVESGLFVAARVPAAVSDLDAVLADARRLLVEHRASAAAAAARIRAAAADPPYRKPGVLARVRDSMRGWVTDHASTLTRISRDLRGVSAALGTLSLVPGFQFLAPVAIVAGTAAIAIDVLVTASTGRGSWTSLAVDTTLTALPSGPATRVVRSLPGAERALKAANRAIPATVRGRIFRTVRNLPEGITTDQLAAAAHRIRSGAPGLTADVVVQGSRAGHSARPTSDIDIGLRVDPAHYAALVRDHFGPANAEARANAISRGRIFWSRAGLKSVHDGLEQDFGRKVGLAIIERGGLFDNEPWLRMP